MIYHADTRGQRARSSRGQLADLECKQSEGRLNSGPSLTDPPPRFCDRLSCSNSAGHHAALAKARDRQRPSIHGYSTVRKVWGEDSTAGALHNACMGDKHSAPRLHVLLALSAEVGVVIRRGPSKRVATFLWDRARDTFQLGQWLKGRIYERRSDLSPDGRHLIYFAFNGKHRTETRGSWTAVSRAPYLHALDLYAKGDCWEGGGLFFTSKSYWLNNRYFCEEDILRDNSGLVRDPTARPAMQFGAECTGVYYPRLIRDGWSLIEREGVGRWNSWTIFEKPLAQGWTLRKIAHEQVDAPPGKWCYWDEHELRHDKLGAIACPDWEWAERDRNAVVWAEQGKLYRAPFPTDGVLSASLVHDFTPYEFQAVKAPYEADGDVMLTNKARKRKARLAARRGKQRR